MNVVQIAAKLYECRDAMRGLYGERFSEVIKGYQVLLRAYADRKGFDIVRAALEMAEDLVANGKDSGVPLLFAAAVELVEPSVGGPADLTPDPSRRGHRRPEDQAQKDRAVLEHGRSHGRTVNMVRVSENLIGATIQPGDGRGIPVDGGAIYG